MIKRIRWPLLVICLPILLLILGIVVPRPLLPSSAAAEHTQTREILLLHNPIHTDIVLRLDDDLRAQFAALGAHGFGVARPEAVYLIFGWGGRSFYIETPTWGDLKPMPVLRALTVDRSVMHVDLAGEIPRNLPQVQSLTLSELGYQRMVQAIKASFSGGDGTVMAVDGAAYGPIDMFFEANGRFNAFLGCNTWTAAMLRAGGLRTGFWTPLPSTLIWSLDLHS